jgi:hypothetical protein
VVKRLSVVVLFVVSAYGVHEFSFAKFGCADKAAFVRQGKKLGESKGRKFGTGTGAGRTDVDISHEKGFLSGSGHM